MSVVAYSPDDDSAQSTEEVFHYLQANLHRVSCRITPTHIHPFRTERPIGTAPDAVWALDSLRPHTCRSDVLVSDLNMPIGSLTLIVRGISPRQPIIIITGFPTEASAIEAVKPGLAGYPVKPFHASEVLAVLGRAPSASAA
jgi:AmiR/NasT family two-component response regulator